MNPNSIIITPIATINGIFFISSSFWQSLLQPSPSSTLPSSQSSFSSKILFPHLYSLQYKLHPSPPYLLPSSHASPLSTMKLPQNSTRHFELHPSPSSRSPLSHYYPISIIQFPQLAINMHGLFSKGHLYPDQTRKQSSEQPSLFIELPSSHT